MSSSNFDESVLKELEDDLGYKRHLLGIKFKEVDPEDTVFSYDFNLTATTEKQIEYFEKCSDSSTKFVRDYYNALCVLDDCVNTGNVSKRDSALKVYEKISRDINSAIGSIPVGEFTPDNILLDYIKKISGRRVTVPLPEIVI